MSNRLVEMEVHISSYVYYVNTFSLYEAKISADVILSEILIAYVEFW